LRSGARIAGHPGIAGMAGDFIRAEHGDFLKKS
jgi:hypothetical protein